MLTFSAGALRFDTSSGVVLPADATSTIVKALRSWFSCPDILSKMLFAMVAIVTSNSSVGASSVNPSAVREVLKITEVCTEAPAPLPLVSSRVTVVDVSTSSVARLR